MTDTLLLVIEYNNPVVRMQRCCICHHDCQQNLSESQNKNIWGLIRDFKKGMDYFIANKSVQVNPIIPEKGNKCKCPRSSYLVKNPNIRK